MRCEDCGVAVTCWDCLVNKKDRHSTLQWRDHLAFVTFDHSSLSYLTRSTWRLKRSNSVKKCIAHYYVSAIRAGFISGILH